MDPFCPTGMSMSRNPTGSQAFSSIAFLLALLAVLVAMPSPLRALPAEESPRIADLSISQRDNEYYLSFRLQIYLDTETLEEIESGLETGFEYEIEVMRSRRFWFDNQVSRSKLKSSVKYDSLSRQYQLMLKVDGNVQRSSTTDKREEMQRWLTEIQDFRLGSISDFIPPEEHLVRVKSDLGPRFVLFFIPWGRDTRWAKVPLSPAPVSSDEPGE